MIVTELGIVRADERVEIRVVGLGVGGDQRGFAVARCATGHRPEAREEPDRDRGRGAEHREPCACSERLHVPSSVVCVEAKRWPSAVVRAALPPFSLCGARSYGQGSQSAEGRITFGRRRSAASLRPMSERPDFRLEHSELRGEDEFDEFASEDLPYYSDWHGSFEKLPWATDDEVAPRGERRRRDRRCAVRRGHVVAPGRPVRSARDPDGADGVGHAPTRGRSSCEPSRTRS